MQLIPVVDIKNGIVVHAKRGDRANYAPIQSEICHSSAVLDVIASFSSLFDCTIIYLADLDSLSKQGDNADVIMQVLRTFPTITFWVDCGYPVFEDDFFRQSNFIPVIGTESLRDENIDELHKFNKNYILSLDYALSGELGAKSLFRQPSLWPHEVIIMCLANVGSNLGPDLARLSTYRRQYPQHQFIAAGGIRDTNDLVSLAQIGIEKVLVASALHNGSISTLDFVSP